MASNVFDIAKKRMEKLAAEHIEAEFEFDNEFDIDLSEPSPTCLTMLHECIEVIGVRGVYQELVCSHR